jgi:hypothetical protein
MKTYGQAFSFLTQPGARGILPDVSKFLGQALIVTKPMIEKVTLPFYARDSCGNAFVIANQRGEVRLTAYSSERAGDRASTLANANTRVVVHDTCARSQTRSMQFRNGKGD